MFHINILPIRVKLCNCNLFANKITNRKVDNVSHRLVGLIDQNIPDVILACAYLHNFILDKEGENADIPFFRDIELIFSTATKKRAAIAALLYLK